MEAEPNLGQTVEVREYHIQECQRRHDNWGIIDSNGKIRSIPLSGLPSINSEGQITARLLNFDKTQAVRKLIGPNGKILPVSNGVEVVNFMTNNRAPVRFVSNSQAKNGTAEGLHSTFSYCTETGQVLTARFDQVSAFKDGIAAVRTGNQVGFIGLDGNFLPDSKKVECQFLRGISEGCLAANLNKLWGFLDFKGNWIIEPKFEYAEPFRDGLALVRVHGRPGNNSENVTYVDKTGKTFSRCFYSGKSFENGYAAASILPDRAGASPLWGLIGKDGKWVVEPKFSRIDDAIDSTRLVYDNKLVGIFFDGKIVVSPKYARIGQFSEGLASFQAIKSKSFGFLDRSGKIVIPAQFPFAGTFSEGLAAVTILGAKAAEYKIGFIDRQGKMTIAPKFALSSPIDPAFNQDFVQFHEGICFIPDRPYRSGKYTQFGSGYIDRFGHWIDKDVITLAYPFHYGQALVRYYPGSEK